MTAYALPAIPYVRLEVTLRAEEPTVLPPFHGSLLRGAFGHALRRTVCVMGPDQPCESCSLRRSCVHPRIFETFVEGEPPPFLRGVRQAARPFVFEPRDAAGRLAPGDPLRFDLLLFGQAVDLQAFVLVALERMARAGLGAGRRRFRLAGIEAADSSGARRLLFAPGAAAERPAAPLLPSAAPLPAGRATLRLLTPLRLKVRDQLADRFTFRDLAFQMLRRALEMAHLHVPDAAIDWSFQPLLAQASGVRIAAADLRWHDWERWSQRQQTSMKLGGVLNSSELTRSVRWDCDRTRPALKVFPTVETPRGASPPPGRRRRSNLPARTGRSTGGRGDPGTSGARRPSGVSGRTSPPPETLSQWGSASAPAWGIVAPSKDEVSLRCRVVSR